MKFSLKSLIKGIVKNSVVFVFSAAIGWLFTVFFLMKFLLEATLKDAGLGVIVLGPIFFILYSFFAVLIGGFIGVFLVNIAKLRKKVRK